MRTRIRGIYFLAFIFSFTLFLFSCSGGGGGSGGDGGGPTTPSSVPGNIELNVTESQSFEMGAAGGDVQVSDIKLSFPEGALSADTVITINKGYAVNPIPVNGAEDVGEMYEFLPSGLSFEKAVEITLPLEGETSPEYEDRYTFVIWEGDHWEEQPCDVDLSVPEITFYRFHFSVGRPVRFRGSKPRIIEIQSDKSNILWSDVILNNNPVVYMQILTQNIDELRVRFVYYYGFDWSDFNTFCKIAEVLSFNHLDCLEPAYISNLSSPLYDDGNPQQRSILTVNDGEYLNVRLYGYDDSPANDGKYKLAFQVNKPLGSFGSDAIMAVIFEARAGNYTSLREGVMFKLVSKAESYLHPVSPCNGETVYSPNVDFHWDGMMCNEQGNCWDWNNVNLFIDDDSWIRTRTLKSTGEFETTNNYTTISLNSDKFHDKKIYQWSLDGANYWTSGDLYEYYKSPEVCSFVLQLTPNTPQDLTAVLVAPDQVQLCWDLASISPNTDKIVVAHKKSTEDWIKFKEIPGDNVCTRINESYNTTYSYRIKALNTYGDSNWSNIATITTGEPSGEPAQEISAGGWHTCALLSFGAVKCWGNNIDGQLGDGNTSYENNVPVDVVGISDAISISARGGGHTCALLSSGAVKCWGDNEYGQLGNGNTVDSSIPVDVVGISDAISISAGDDHTCAVLSSGAVKCWGWNGYSPLGNGSTVDSSIPVDVVGISDAISISAGGGHTCALLLSGTIKCWGSNFAGQLGNGSNNDSPVPVDVVGISDAISISVGTAHTCALLSSGAIKCWGYNLDGELGDGSTIPRNSPVNVLGISDAISISAGGTHTCAVLSSGAVKCWGRNEYGQLGDGSNIASKVPVDVFGINNAVQVSARGWHTCALLSSGAVKCWGANWDGELGDGSSHHSNVPVDVVGIGP